MKTFGQVLGEARKKAGITQRELAARLKREDGRPVDPPYLNAVEHDHRYPPEDYLIEQMAKIVGISPDVLYFHANRHPADVKADVDQEQVEAAYRAFRKALAVKPALESRREIAINCREIIVIDPTIHHGDPCIKGTCVPVSVIVGSIADGDTPEQIIDAWPQLTRDDIKAALKFAAGAASSAWKREHGA